MSKEECRKIAIIAGSFNHVGVLSLFSLWEDIANITVFCFQDASLGLYQGKSKLEIFSPLENTPGFMEGLENRLNEYHAIILVGPTQLCCFQAARYARKHNIPFITIVNDYQTGVYNRFRNLEAIQFDILQNSQQVWATSHLAYEYCEYYQTPSKNLKLIPFCSSLSDVGIMAQKREKFRRAIGLHNDETLILVHSPLEQSYKPELVINAMAIQVRQDPALMKNVKVLFCAQGALLKSLQFLAYEQKLGAYTMFLSQENGSFIDDVLCAADMGIYLHAYHNEYPEPYPVDMLQAFSAGIFPIFLRGSLAEEWGNNLGLALNQADAFHLGLAIKSTLQNWAVLTLARPERQIIMQQKYNLNRFFQESKTSLLALLEDSEQRPMHLKVFMEQRQEIELAISQGDEDRALVLIEEGFLSFMNHPNCLTDLYFLKGSLHLAHNDMTAALAALEASLSHNAKNYATLRSLGTIAYLSHFHEEALNYFKRALSICPEDSLSILGIGMTFARVGLVEEAFYWLEKAVTFGELEKRALVSLMQVAMECTDKKLAITVLERVMESIGEVPMLLLTLAELLNSDGKHQRADELRKKATATEIPRLAGRGA